METIELTAELYSKITYWKVFCPATTWSKLYKKDGCKKPETALRRAKKKFPFPSESWKLRVSGLTMHAETKVLI